jgi:hypothetical protein
VSVIEDYAAPTHPTAIATPRSARQSAACGAAGGAGPAVGCRLRARWPCRRVGVWLGAAMAHDAERRSGREGPTAPVAAQMIRRAKDEAGRVGNQTIPMAGPRRDQWCWSQSTRRCFRSAETCLSPAAPRSSLLK